MSGGSPELGIENSGWVTSNRLSQFLQALTIAHWKAYKRILRYSKGKLNYGFLFKPAQLLYLEGFCDAN